MAETAGFAQFSIEETRIQTFDDLVRELSMGERYLLRKVVPMTGMTTPLLPGKTAHGADIYKQSETIQ